ncbi:MAG: glycogen/starch/alpha-glucan phosphorylase [Christensenellaceae bacterium]|jgi:starch phosphorylase|nr:glycogen/starch/alpha-glucan phosphorylase [Christensenellaceae bacterium]
MKNMTKIEFKKLLEQKLMRVFGTEYKDASKAVMYKAVCLVTRDILAQKRLNFYNRIKEGGHKQIYYMSMEFLLGRSLKNNLFNLDILDIAQNAVSEMGFDIEELMEIEPDAGLGNGGLGRLAAAYLDSLTSCGYAAGGFSIRYDYGIFNQKIVDGWQVEMPDKWLIDGGVWLNARDSVYEVKFGGHIEERWENGRLICEHKDYTPIIAVSFEMPISGYQTDATNFLRLWSAKTKNDIDMALFSKGEYLQAIEAKAMAEAISKILYPADNHFEGKSLRLKQQYFFVSASMQCVVKYHLKTYGTLDTLPDKAAIHINDTHPALCVPELMRILLDVHGYDWDKAWEIVCETISYTNHTVMQEALEKWPQGLFESLLPRIFQIVKEINKRYCGELWKIFPGEWTKISENAILSDGEIRMANLCLVASHSVNGVSALHSEILKNDLFEDYYKVAPYKFKNVTNGITYRRWLAEANPLLTKYITELIGDKFLHNADELENLLAFKGNHTVLNRFAEIKLKNKERLAEYIKKANGVSVDPNAIFDVQVKRLHEYKRQLLNVFHIMDLYRRLKENPNLDVQPRVFIFGAKAAGSYYMAKLIIRLIYMLGEVINNDPTINDKIKIIFIENYRVSLAEIIMPASEISEQISVAGKEASGTGNMKFMINGAVTIGTMDGANVEIHEKVGDENIFIFGLSSQEADQLYPRYNPTEYYSHDWRIQSIIDKLRAGINGVNFSEIADRLLIGYGGVADPYLVLADFASYVDAQASVDVAYKDLYRFQRMAITNTAKSGFFSSDRSVEEYANKIWALSKVVK